jgi:hypothetical protein
MEEKLQGRVTVIPVTNVSQFLLPPSRKRIKLVFLPGIANRVTWFPQDTTVVDGQGIALAATAQPVEIVGQLAKMGWSAINSAAGPSNFTVIEYYASDEGEPRGK